MSDVFRYSIDVSDVLSCFQMFSGCSQGMLIRKANGQNASRVGFWGGGGGHFPYVSVIGLVGLVGLVSLLGLVSLFGLVSLVGMWYQVGPILGTFLLFDLIQKYFEMEILSLMIQKN